MQPAPGPPWRNTAGLALGVPHSSQYTAWPAPTSRWPEAYGSMCGYRTASGGRVKWAPLRERTIRRPARRRIEGEFGRGSDGDRRGPLGLHGLLDQSVEREPGLGVEQVDLVQRHLEVEDVTRLDPVGAVDDRDDIVAPGAHVDELLVAEVLDDVSLALERACRR